MPGKLCIGTAQFGGKYGITNKQGLIDDLSAKEIISTAIKSGIHHFDTAQSYGAAEEVVGRHITNNNQIKIISKLKSQPQIRWSDFHKNNWDNNLLNTIRKLNVKCLDTFLVHQASDLMREDSSILIDWLLSIKERGLTKKIGISIYETSDINSYFIELFDVVQLPLSLYDQRFLNNGLLQKLKHKNIEIHARSIFLQGLILERNKNWPKIISKSFKKHHSELEENLMESGITLLQAAIGFVRNCEDIDLILIGVTSLVELQEIIKVWEHYENSQLKHWDFSNWAWDNKQDIDPRLWKR